MSIVLNGTDQYAWYNGVIGGALPKTFVCWAKRTSSPSLETALVSNGSTASSYHDQLTIYGSASSPSFAVVANDDRDRAISTDVTTLNNWHHCAAIFINASSRAALLDGANKGTNTDTSPDRTYHTTGIGVGRRQDGTPDGLFTGKIAHAAIWSVVLSDAEIASLAAGAIPTSVQPDNLLAYWPLLEDAGDDTANGYDLTEVGTPTYDAEDNPEVGSLPVDLTGEITAISSVTGNLTVVADESGLFSETLPSEFVINTGTPLGDNVINKDKE